MKHYLDLDSSYKQCNYDKTFAHRYSCETNKNVLTTNPKF